MVGHESLKLGMVVRTHPWQPIRPYTANFIRYDWLKWVLTK